MAPLGNFLRRYPIVAATVVIAALGGIAVLLGAEPLARWVLSGYAIVIAVTRAWAMVRDMIKGRWGLDILAVLAIAATIAVGEYWASLIIVLMLAGGEALEDFAAGRAKRELSALLSRAPQRAHRLRGEESEDVLIDEVRIGDELLVRPAEIVPVDGVLLTAEAEFDESSLTGESLPVDHVAGDPILSGSVNGSRAVTMRVSALAADSQYQRIVALVADAAGSKAPMVRLADRYAVPFTAVALLIAGLAWLLSGDPVRFAEVLVVATPCPLLIAAPVAFMGGMSRAARHGVIVKGGGTLEQLARAKTVAFDKTGTLTTGTPVVVAVQPAAGFSEDELLAHVAAAEQYSSHVLASSIVAAAKDRGLALPTVSRAGEEATNGVVAQIEGREVIVGKKRYVAEHSTGLVDAVPAGGELAVYVSIGGRFAGTVLLRDSLRANAKETLEELGKLGVVRTLILTGDAKETAAYVAATLGVSDVRAELLPADKVTIVREIAERPVVMVGDGVNDAPVLAVADVGIAMGAKGATAASESADAVILLDDISKTADAILIGKKTVRVAKQSIWLGIILSVGLMLVGAFGFLPAVIGAALQEFVDLATILNSLRALGTGRKARAAVGAGAVRAVARVES